SRRRWRNAPPVQNPFDISSRRIPMHSLMIVLRKVLPGGVLLSSELGRQRLLDGAVSTGEQRMDLRPALGRTTTMGTRNAVLHPRAGPRARLLRRGGAPSGGACPRGLPVGRRLRGAGL